MKVMMMLDGGHTTLITSTQTAQDLMEFLSEQPTQPHGPQFVTFERVTEGDQQDRIHVDPRKIVALFPVAR